MAPTTTELQYLVDVAMGRKPASLLIINARVVNVFTLEAPLTHVLIAGRFVAGVGTEFAKYQAEKIIDLEGKYISPGLIDGHLHLESSMVTPDQYAVAVVPKGVTGCVADPHEIANAAGVEGVEWLIEASKDLPLEVWMCVPSSVPSTSLETTGATLGAAEISHLLCQPSVVGVAELMSFPKILDGDIDELHKVTLADGARKSPEGHAPTLMGAAMHAYFSTGIASDHESTTLEEGRGKLEAGCFLMIREGTTTRNLEALVSLLDVRFGERIGLVTDDRLPSDLLNEGGVDFLVRKAVQLGAEPFTAIRAASWNIARHYGLRRRGAVAPGYMADFSLLNDLNSFGVQSVFKSGRLVAQDGILISKPPSPVPSAVVSNTVKLPTLSEKDLEVPANHKYIRAVRPVPHQVLTEEERTEAVAENGMIVSSGERDLAKFVCLERYGKNGNIGLAMAVGTGLKFGAIASTVAHDHHNLLVLGMNDADIIVAAERLQTLGGGFVAVYDGRVLAELPLPIAGLITPKPLAEVAEQMRILDETAAEMGMTIPSPFMTLSFMGLAVIPEIRLTDHGLVDVRNGKLVPLGMD